jgi:uncharacterized protein with HEPN domain
MIHDDSVFLAHIADALQQIAEYTAGMDYEQFRTKRMVHDAVIREFEIIGEAAKNLSDDFGMRHPEFPCKDLAGFRDKLIHQYFGVDLTLVWHSVVADVPVLQEKLGKAFRA